MQTVSHRVSDTLYVVRQTVSKVAKVAPKPVATNHVAVIDCSGSMYGDLPKIREQLKRKLPKMLRDGDTISIVWFSSRGEFGTLLEAEPVATLADLKDVNSAIDRWLRPVGLTGFKEPLEEVERLVGRVSQKSPGSAFALFFMSDGCDNQWGRPDVLKAVEKAAGSVTTATFVEYGYYADRNLLSQMAERAGGTLIFAQDFDQFAPSLEAALQKRGSGAPRVEVDIPGDPVGGFAYSLVDGDLVTFSVENGKISIPETVTEIAYVAPSPVGKVVDDVVNVSKYISSKGGDDPLLAASYAAVSLYAQRMKPDVVYPLLKALGDVSFIETFAGCFGKQKYSEFMDAARGAAFDVSGRFKAGWDPNKAPRDDAFTVLDLLRILSKDDGNRLLLDHPAFEYSRIGRGRVDSGEVMTQEEQDEIAKLTSQLAGEKSVKKIQDINARIAAITAAKAPALKFEPDPAPDGYSISNLTFNEDRPNISVLVRKTGTVDLSSRLTDFLKGKVPARFPSFVYRNYTVVKDGLVNVSALPVKLSDATRAYLSKLVADGDAPASAIQFGSDGVDVVLLNKLPVINRQMIKETSARALFEKEYELTCARAAQKVYNTYRKELFPKKSEGFEASYGKDGADWLKEQGITDYSGFNPKSVQAESTDFYMSKELTVSLKGLSSLPSLKDAKAKTTPSAMLMKPAIKEFEDFMASSAYTGAPDKDRVLETWLDDRQSASVKKVRGLLFEMAQIKFSVIVGQIWFKEFKSLDENTMTVDVNGIKVEGKVEMKESQVRI